ncbi:MAG: phytanoyl-CoA dioxygenase family protein [Candidatus Cyclobacteriaceae bacterium M3_2C_046]
MSDLKVLSSQDVAHYKEKGYILYHQQLFPRDKFGQLNQILDEHLADKGSKLSDELDTPHFRDPRLFDYLMDPHTLDLVEDILGPNIGLWSSHFICKDPIVGRRTPWHEDSAYWEGKFEKLDKIVTIWLALDDSRLENGCMGVVPGSHCHGFSQYEAVDAQTNTFQEEIKAGSFDEADVVWFELNQGACSLHDARIIHGAKANTSQKRRCGYTMRYFSLEMKYNTDLPGNEKHTLYHCRGENIAGNPLTYR